MSRYIDADEIVYFNDTGEDRPIEAALVAYKGQIDRIPSADVAPVVHGRWVYSDEIRYMPRCTNCGATPFKGYIPSIEEVRRTYKFCPCCNAKMDESEDKNNG